MSSLPSLDLQAARSATMRRPTAPSSLVDSSIIGGYAELTDTQLLDAARDGDGAAYAMLWERYRGTASRIARRYLPSHDADDAVSESFAQIWSTLLSGGGPTQSFGAYLAVSVRNIAGRFTTRNRAVPVDATEQSVLDQAIEDPDFVGDDLERDLAVAAFKSLSPRHQRALMLSIEQDTDHAADTLGVSRRGFTSLAYRARENLRRAYLSAYVEPTVTAQVVEDECRQFRNELGAHVRGGLRQAERQALEVHLVTCTGCDKVYQEVLELNATMPSPQRMSAIAIPLVPILMGGWLAGLFGLGAKSAGAGASAGTAGSSGGGVFGGAGAGATAGVSGIAVGGAVVGVAAAIVAAAVILPGVLSPNDGQTEAGAGRGAASVPSAAEPSAETEVVEEPPVAETPGDVPSGDSPGNLLPPLGGVGSTVAPGAETGSQIEAPGPVPGPGKVPTTQPSPSPSASVEPTGDPSTEPTTSPPTTPPTTPPTDPTFIETWLMTKTASATLMRVNAAASSGVRIEFDGKPSGNYLVALRMETETAFTVTSNGSVCWIGESSIYRCLVSLDSSGDGDLTIHLPTTMVGQEIAFGLHVFLGSGESAERRFVIERL